MSQSAKLVRKEATADLYLSNKILLVVLNRADLEELEALSKALDDSASGALGPAELEAQACAAAGHAVGNWLRNGSGVSYAELLSDAAGHLKVKGLKSRYSSLHEDLHFAELDRLKGEKAKRVPPDARLKLVDDFVDEYERKLLAQLMAAAYERATPEQRAKVDAKLAEIARSSQGKGLSGLSTPAALLVIGNLGGFATYTMMSTVLSVISAGTLGFGAYTFASSLLSVVLGPAGWLTLAAYGAFKLGSPNAGKTVQVAATCAMTSQRLREERRRRAGA